MYIIYDPHFSDEIKKKNITKKFVPFKLIVLNNFYDLSMTIYAFILLNVGYFILFKFITQVFYYCLSMILEY